MKRLLFIFLLTNFLFSCEKKEENSRHITYAELLEGLVLDCPNETKEHYFKGIVNGIETCYYDTVDSKRLDFSITSKFTTSGSSFTTGDTTGVSDARKGAYIGLLNPAINIQGDDEIKIYFPDFNLERDDIEYLDSLFAIENHLYQTELQERNRFEVALEIVDLGYYSESGGGGNIYPISSRFGSQEDSVFRFREVRKEEEGNKTYFYIELEIDCNLYHFSQHGQEGLWGRIEDGLFVAKFPVH